MVVSLHELSFFSWRVCAFCCSLQQGSSSSSEQLQAASSSSLE
jgi:hypothetical protein